MEGARSKVVLMGTVAGVAVGCVVAGLLVVTGALRIPVHRDGRDASADFLKAWERNRRGTFVVESDFRRRLGDGRTLYSPSKLAQRPPDRLIRQFGGLDGTINGHPVICSTDQGGNFSCFAGAATAPDFDKSVTRELDTFRSYFADPIRPPPAGSGSSQGPTSGTVGSAPSSPSSSPDTIASASNSIGLYRVGYSPEPGCFEFFQKIRYPDAPYGSYARFCFDDATGAMRSLERHLANNVVETLTANRVSPSVSPLDLDTSQNDQYESRMDMGAFPQPSPPDTSGAKRSPPRPGSPSEADLAKQPNLDLVVNGSDVADKRGDVTAYVDEAVRRMKANNLSVNSRDWIDERGRVRELLQPVVVALLSTGIYYGPT